MAVSHGESDLVLEMNKASTMNEILTLFAIEGESYRGGICPSGQCNYEGSLDPYFGPPTAGAPGMSVHLGFILKDNIAIPNVGPNEKEYLEQFSISSDCRVNDFIEDNGQEIYTCDDGSATVTRNFDSKSWDYNTNSIYDAKKNTLKLYGNYTGSR